MTKNPHTESNCFLSLTRLNQKLRREELKLARLKSRQDENRLRDTRLKYRLGGLVFMLGWENDDHERLEERLKQVGQQLSDGNCLDHYKAIGSDEFRRRERNAVKTASLSTAGLSEKQRLALNHQVIELGGLMVKYGLDQFPRDAVFGNLMMTNASQQGFPKS